MATSSRRIDTLQSVELAEGMEIHLRAAGPFLRFIAYFLDLIFEILILLVVGFVIGILGSVLGGNVAMGVYYLLYFFIWWFYHVFFELSRWGATPGKRIFGLRVVDEAGGSVSLGQSMIRNFLRGMEIITPFVPLVAFFHPRFQRLGDLAAGSMVVYSKPRVEYSASGPPPMKAVPVTCALTREEEAAILSFRYRSGGWSEARRVELTNHLQVLTGELGPKGVQKLLGMATWLEGQR
jgi:uncharacterized RDD family membrane protein YckC